MHKQLAHEGHSVRRKRTTTNVHIKSPLRRKGSILKSLFDAVIEEPGCVFNYLGGKNYGET